MTEATSTQPTTTCAHCGDPCPNPKTSTTTNFCCAGCKTVYELIHNHGLAQFYDLSEKPGNSLKSLQTAEFDYLDQAKIQDELLDFRQGDLAKVTLYLPDIHCASCIWLLEHLHEFENGIESSTVNFLNKALALQFRLTTTKLSELVALLHQIGYPPALNLADLNQKERPTVSKGLLYKLGVTGFLFGNIMFMSFPDYFGILKVTSADQYYFQWFAYLNLLLSLPLVFYAGWDYLRSAFLGLRQYQLNIDIPIAIGILSLFLRSAYEILSQTGAGYIDSLAGLIFFLLIGKWFQQKTYHEISFERDYQSYFPIATQKIVAEQTQSVPLHELKLGDRIRVRQQELIPADSILLSDFAHIDYSFVTGEAIPVPLERGATIYAGGRQLGPAIELRVEKEVVQSYLIQLWNEQTFTEKKSSASESEFAARVGKYFTILILLVAFITLGYWLLIDSTKAMNAFSAVLIIACPCAVALAIPFAYGNVLRLLARRQFYLKNTLVLEQLQKITHIVFDKTGTLTERKGTLKLHGKLTEKEIQALCTLVHQSNHPRSQQILAYFPPCAVLPITHFKEQLGHGIQGIVAGQQIAVFKSKRGTSLTINGEEHAYFEHQAKLRKNVASTLAQLAPNFDLSLLSGDQDHHAQSFEKLFLRADALHFNHSPKEKLAYIKKLQAQGATVLMVGDGLNDAGALQQADVGLVITEENNNFSPACDGILSSTNFAHFASFLSYIQQSKWIIYLAYGFALVYNVFGLSYAVQATLSPVIAAILMPLSSITIILLAVLGTFGLWWFFEEEK